MRRVQSIIVAVALLGLGVVASARAGSYAISYNNVFDFSITGSAGVIFAPFVPVPVFGLSESSATLPPAAPLVLPAPLDPPPANLGTAEGTADNSFSPLGKAGQYARGDAVKDDAILWVGDLGFTAPGGQARNIGESFLGGPGTGSGSGSNVWMLPFIVPFGGGTLTFEFQADPYIEVSVNPDAPAGTTAAGSLVVTIHGPLPDVPGGTWAPNGLLDIVGEVADPFSLNTSLFLGGPGEDLYDPTGDASFGIDPPTAGAFEATFDAPVSGVLEIRISETVETSKPTGIPEPATLFLVATGLAGLAFARRRKGA